MQSRLPRAEESHQIQFQSGNYDNNALRFDSTGALNEDETWLYRMTGSAASSGSQIENTKQSRYLIAPSITWQPLNNLSWTVAGVYQHDPYVGYYNTLPAAALGLLPPLLSACCRRLMALLTGTATTVILIMKNRAGHSNPLLRWSAGRYRIH